MQFDRNKLKSVIEYVISKCPASKLGAVKLHKVLYFSDMLRYAETSNSITGSTYCKSPFGPTCKQLPAALVEAVADDAVRIETANYFGYRKKEFISLRPANLDPLSKEEISLIDEMITFVCENNSAKTISDLSHNRAWESVEFGEEIKYNSVYHIFPTEVSDDALAWASAEVENVEASRSSHNTVDFGSFAALRSRVLAGTRN